MNNNIEPEKDINTTQNDNKHMNKLFGIAIICLWSLLAILNLFMPKAEFSETENRELAEFPAFSLDDLVEGKFMQGVDVYINDHVFGRDTWVTVKSQMEYYMGMRESNGIYICNNQLIEDITVPDDKTVQANIDGIKHYAEIFGKPVYLMIIPSADSIQKDKLPLFATQWDEKSFITGVNEKMGSSITPINVYDTLYAHKDEYIYYRTDHHWTSDGAFLAYEELSKVMKLSQNSFDSLIKTSVTEDFNGTLHSKSGYRNVEPDIINSYQLGTAAGYTVNDGKKTEEFDSIYFPDRLNTKDKYSYFLNGNYPAVTIKTESTSGKKLLIFKDSYSHCFIPMLMKDYSEITLIDFRYINGNVKNYFDMSRYDDTLFMYSVDVFSHQKNSSMLKTIGNKADDSSEVSGDISETISEASEAAYQTSETSGFDTESSESGSSTIENSINNISNIKTEDSSVSVNPPQTGDDIFLYSGLLISTASIIFVVANRRKQLN